MLLAVIPGRGFVAAQSVLQPPQGLYLTDTPNDNGSGVCLIWNVSPDATLSHEYVIYSSTSPDGPFQEIRRFPATLSLQSDYPEHFGFSKALSDFHCAPLYYPLNPQTREPIPTWYQLAITDGTELVYAAESVTGFPVENRIAWNKLNNFILLAVLFAAIGYYIQRARSNPNLFIRRIPGLEAVDEAVGRATEMGKPLLYLTGVYEISELSTLASVNILRHVAETVAQYDSRLINPHRKPIAMTVCQEVLKEAYVKAGRPDGYRQDDVYFVTDDAFGFTAAVDGLIVREKPAANFFLGTFSAEALLLAETGATTGAIQIAGTDSTYQIPFFIVACDYTLIGEELYAASAYLSREPKLLGSLRGQDFGKVILMAAIIVGTVGACLYTFFPNAEWLLWVHRFFTKT